MFNIHELNYLEAMKDFHDPQSIDFEGQEKIVLWLDHVYYRRFDDATIETIAGIILQDYPQLSGNQTKRYQFNTDHKSQLLKIVFDRSFKKASEESRTGQLITQAEIAGSKKIFYSKWKKIVQIQLPRVAAHVIRHPVFIVTAVSVAYFTVGLGVLFAYSKVQALTLRVIFPFVLNHAPAQAIKAYPFVGAACRLYYVFMVAVIVGCGAGNMIKSAARGLRIYWISRILNSVDFDAICHRLPKPITGPIYAVISASRSMLNTFTMCTQASGYLKELSASIERSEIMQARMKAFEVWMTLMKNRPEPIAV